MAEDTVPNVIRQCYLSQTKWLQVHYVLSALYQSGIIPRSLKECISAAEGPHRKRELLLSHLECQNIHTLEKYCKILESSAFEDCLPVHGKLAVELRGAIQSCSRLHQSSDSDLESFLHTLSDDNEELELMNIRGYKLVRVPNKICASGPLVARQALQMGRLLLGLPRKKSDVALDVIFSKPQVPLDLKIQLSHSASGDGQSYIGRLENVLQMCNSEDCQNSVLLQFKLHTHLAWCYYGYDQEHFEKHYTAALQMMQFVSMETSYPLLWELQSVKLALELAVSSSMSEPLSEEVANDLERRAVQCSLQMLHLARKSSLVYGYVHLELFAMLHRALVHALLAKYHTTQGNVVASSCHMTVTKEMLIQVYSYPSWRGVSHYTGKAWFMKFVSLLNLPQCSADAVVERQFDSMDLLHDIGNLDTRVLKNSNKVDECFHKDDTERGTLAADSQEPWYECRGSLNRGPTSECHFQHFTTFHYTHRIKLLENLIMSLFKIAITFVFLCFMHFHF